MTLARRALAALLVAGACAATAHAQAQGERPGVSRLPGSNVPESALPQVFAQLGIPEAPRLQRPFAPLDPARGARLRRAMELRVGGQVGRARDSLLALDRELPHHALITIELARALLASDGPGAAVTRLRAERAVLRDTLLGARELADALERLGRPREAAQAALEAWCVSVPQGPWALPVLLRLAPADPRGVTDAMRTAAARRPWREDLARGTAELLARQGRAAEAASLLAAVDRPSSHGSVRLRFAEDALTQASPVDSAAAIEAMVSLVADTGWAAPVRLTAAARALEAAPFARRGDAAERLARGLASVPSGLLGEPLLLSLVRTLREAGLGRAAAALLARAADRVSNAPELALERSYGTLREGPPERAIPALDSLARIWPPAHFALAEAQFFAGQLDSALANYQRAAANSTTPEALTALDRAYLLEERRDDGAALVLGRIAWERWRGGAVRARVLADSLWKALPRESPCYSRAALQEYELLAEAGEWRAALVPLASVADSLPGDRLAPLARQRAGEAWIALGDDRHALEQFEECLARYPRAWNAAEVRRRVDQLRRERRL